MALDGFVAFLRASGAERLQRAADNLDAETLVPDADWNDLAAGVGPSGPWTDDTVSKEYESWCYAHQRHGPEIDPPLPVLLGRAILGDRFLVLFQDGLEAAGRGKLTENDAANILRDFGYLDPLTTDPRLLAATPLGAHVLWATYDATDPAGDPEKVLNGDDPAASASDVFDRAALRFPADLDGNDVLIPVYRRDATRIHAPTVADADFAVLFRPSPAPPGQPGRTVPASGRPGIPEVVHEVVHADRLVRRLGRYHE
ncbi:MAG: hypothetical protein HY744_28785 [Deltaproteobacteria bacterium]|nr:hypothetical protein [Deltaproteobacteria bacterium]